MKQLKMAIICLMMTFVAFANAEVSHDTKIFQTLKNSGIVTDVNGKIVDLRGNAHLQPGEQIYLNFQDGFDTIYTAKNGDNPWVVCGALINYLEPAHGSVLTDTTGLKKQGKGAPVNTASINLFAMLAKVPAWVWVLLMLASAIAFAFGMTRRQKRLAEENRIANDPVLAGPPVLREGITDANVQEAMQYAAQTVYNTTLPITIHEMTRGTLNGQGVTVFFNGAPSKDNMVLNNKRGVRAIVSFGEGENRVERAVVYSLFDCGNPIRRGEFIVGSGITFTADPVASNIPVQTNEPQQPQAESSEVTVYLGNGTTALLQNAVNLIKGSGNGGTIDFTANEDGIKFTLNVERNMLALPAGPVVGAPQTSNAN